MTSSGARQNWPQLSALSPSQQKAELDLTLLELARRERDEKLRFFSPNASQSRWIDEIARDGAFIVVNAAGNGSGKTYGIVEIVGAFLWPKLAPTVFNRAPWTKFKGPKRARIISTPKELEEVGSLQTAISELWPRGKYEANKKGKSFYSQFKTDTGWTVDMMSYEQDVSEFAGPNLGLQVFNEPPPKNIWDESIARTRSGGYVLAAMTSLRDNPWVVDGLLGKADGKSVRVVYGDIEDNCKQHGVNGTLEHEHIERMLAQYDPDEREARKTGKPLSLSGRIYKAFDRDVHVAREPIAPLVGGVSHYMSVDPAIGKPMAAIWAYVDGAGVVHVYDEYPDFDFEGSKDSNLTIREYASIFLRKEPSQVRDSITRIIDRHFAGRQQTAGGITLKQEFAEVGLGFIDSYKTADVIYSEVETGIQCVKDYLSYNKRIPLSGVNRPKLIISPKCRNLIKGFERWVRNPDTGKPEEAFKDHMDCLRYLLKADPVYQAPKNWTRSNQPHYGVGT